MWDNSPGGWPGDHPAQDKSLGAWLEQHPVWDKISAYWLKDHPEQEGSLDGQPGDCLSLDRDVHLEPLGISRMKGDETTGEASVASEQTTGEGADAGEGIIG